MHSHRPGPPSTPAKAAFFDVDGTLVSTNVVHAYGYYATNTGTVRGTLSRSLATLLKLPLYAGLDLLDRKTFNEYFYKAYQGLTEDRLVTLAEDWFEDQLKGALFSKSQDLLDEARRSGCKIVLVTGALDFTMQPLARYLGVDALIANKMQFVGGVATGKVIPPIIEGANKAHAIRRYCETEGMSLNHCHAYSDSASDYAMLTLVGRPTAVNPDFRLRSLARSYHWPILELT